MGMPAVWSAPPIRSVPPEKVRSPEVSPSALAVLTRRVPEVSVTPPEKVFSPVSFTVPPEAAISSVPEPVMTLE